MSISYHRFDEPGWDDVQVIWTLAGLKAVTLGADKVNADGVVKERTELYPENCPEPKGSIARIRQYNRPLSSVGVVKAAGLPETYQAPASRFDQPFAGPYCRKTCRFDESNVGTVSICRS